MALSDLEKLGESAKRLSTITQNLYMLSAQYSPAYEETMITVGVALGGIGGSRELNTLTDEEVNALFLESRGTVEEIAEAKTILKHYALTMNPLKDAVLELPPNNI